MNPSYFRIKLPFEEAKVRLCKWWGIDAPTELINIDYFKAVESACNENGNWRGAALYVYENDEWTVFEDLSGGFATIPADSWAKFAQKDSFIFAGYNDAIPYGELIVIDDGEIIREFLDFSDEPEENVDIGKLEQEEETPIESWCEVASFVDEDDIAFSDTGWLWVQCN